MEFTITKEQIIDLAENQSGRRAKLKQWFPDAFKKELEVGRWYKSSYYLICYIGNYKCYGFNLISGKWVDEVYHSESSNLSGLYRPATTQEVESALIEEAKRRGYIEGAIVNGHTLKNVITAQFPNMYFYDNHSNILFACSGWHKYATVFRKGEWMNLSPASKKLTVAEVEELLGYSVEIISEK